MVRGQELAPPVAWHLLHHWRWSWHLPCWRPQRPSSTVPRALHCAAAATRFGGSRVASRAAVKSIPAPPPRRRGGRRRRSTRTGYCRDCAVPAPGEPRRSAPSSGAQPRSDSDRSDPYRRDSDRSDPYRRDSDRSDSDRSDSDRRDRRRSDARSAHVSPFGAGRRRAPSRPTAAGHRASAAAGSRGRRAVTVIIALLLIIVLLLIITARTPPVFLVLPRGQPWGQPR